MIPRLYMLPSVPPVPERPRTGASPLPTGSSPSLRPVPEQGEGEEGDEHHEGAQDPPARPPPLGPDPPVDERDEPAGEHDGEPAPDADEPGARPRLLLANQAEASPINGTLVAPLPMPVIM